MGDDKFVVFLAYISHVCGFCYDWIHVHLPMLSAFIRETQHKRKHWIAITYIMKYVLFMGDILFLDSIGPAKSICIYKI